MATAVLSITAKQKKKEAEKNKKDGGEAKEEKMDVDDDKKEKKKDGKKSNFIFKYTRGNKNTDMMVQISFDWKMSFAFQKVKRKRKPLLITRQMLKRQTKTKKTPRMVKKRRRPRQRLKSLTTPLV